MVVQAYLRDADETLERILALPALGGREGAAHDPARQGRLLGSERVIAAQRGWASPVWAEKDATDACFERLSHALIARATGPPRDRHPQPSLVGPGDRPSSSEAAGARTSSSFRCCAASATSSPTALGELGHRVRVYTPIGDLVAGMAYLVRRLLENSSNQGFLLQRRHHSLDELLERPVMDEFRNHPLLELRRPEVREELTGALAALDAELHWGPRGDRRQACRCPPRR